MNILKYTEFISFPLISILGIYLIYTVKGYDIYKKSLSMIIFDIKNDYRKYIFYFIFILKGTLGILFAIYIMYRFDINIIIAILSIIHPIFFASGVYITESKSRFWHRVFTYSSGLLWFCNMIYISILIQSTYLVNMGIIIAIIVFLSGFLITKYSNQKQINFIYQTISILLMWIYITIITFSM